jgi:hypothetical protein
MAWYQALPIIGSAIALAIMIFTHPTSESRPIGLTLLVGALVMVSIGFALRDLVEAFYIAAWLASS